MNHKAGRVPTPELRGGVVILRPFTTEDIRDEYIGWLNDAETVKYSEQRHRRHDRDSCLAFLARFDQLTSHFWAVYGIDGTYVGTATASRDTANATADLGILIGAAGVQRRGLGTEAWLLMRDWLFEIGVRKVTAGTMSVNAPMLRIFEKTGMIVEGVRRREFLWNGTEVDLVLAAAFHDK